MNKHAFVRREGIRSSALLSAVALATTGLIAAAAPAGAALSQGGNDATTGAPAYFADSQGVAVQLCLEACAEVDRIAGLDEAISYIAQHDDVWFATGEEIVRAWLQSGATF